MNETEIKSKLCLDCKRCCKKIGIATLYPYDEYVTQFYEARGFKCMVGNNHTLFLEKELPCPHLDEEHGCLIYDKRPQACREYDGRNDFGGECLWTTMMEDSNVED